MGRASLTIAVSGTYNGRALERARQDLQAMRVAAASELGGASTSLINFGSRLAEVGGEIHNAGYKMQRIGDAATAGITLPIAAAAFAVGKAAVDMDASLTNVKKTVDGTDKQYQDLKDSAIEFSKTNAVSASQIMDIQSLGAQLGFAIDELDEFSRVTAGLDISTNMDAEQAATEMAQFANITKMAHDDVSNYGSAIVGLGNNMATTESDISSMAMRLAAAGTQVGMSQADILGLAAALSSMGVEAEAGGTAISTIMSQIDKDVATNSSKLEVWAETAGMTSQEFADAWRKDPVQALGALLSNMEATTAEGGNMSVMLDELGISSLRQTDVLKRLAGNSDLVTEAVALSNDEWKKNKALQDEVDNRNASLSARFQILQNKVVATAEKVGTPLVNALLDVLEAADPLIDGIADMAQAFADMDKKDQKMILGLVGAAAAFGPVTSVAGRFAQGIGNLITTVGKGAQSLGVLKGEFNLIRSATSAAVGPTASIGQAVGNLGSQNIPMVTGALGALKTAFIGLGIGAAIVAIGAIVTAIKDVIDHEQKVVDATYGLETAMGAAADAYNSYTEGADVATKSLGEVKARTEEVLESQAKLAEKSRETWTEYGTNAALVDAYAQQIQTLTTKYDENGQKVQLTADEQARLKLAVDGFNEAAGTSIEVTDALTGTLNTSTETIMANAEAFKEQARQQAAIELYKDMYKQQLEDEMALNDATAKLNELKALEADAWQYATNGVNPYSYQVQEAQKNVDDLTAAIDSSKASQEQMINVMTSANQGFASFDEALAQSGISLSDFGTLTDQQLETLRQSFDGNLSSIVTACNETGVAVPPSLAKAISDNASIANEAGSGLGKSVDEGIKEGIDNNADKPKSGIEAVGNDIVDFFKNLFGIHSPSTLMASMGRDIDLGLQQGINGLSSGPVDAMSAIGRSISGAVSGLPNTLYSTGSSASSKFERGVNSNSSYNVGQNFVWGFSRGMGGVDIWTAAWNVGCSALDAIKSALGIASPSKEAAKVGEWFGEGAVIGMKRTEGAIAAESDKLSSLMGLNPQRGFSSHGFAGSGFAAPQINMNVTVNVGGGATADTRAVGVDVVDAIYEELQRRMGAALWAASPTMV